MLNQRGHTLVELMVASGLIVFAMLAFATMITGQRNVFLHSQQTVEATSAMKQIQEYLSNPETCTRVMIGQSPNAPINMKVIWDGGTPAKEVFWTDEYNSAKPQRFNNLIFLDTMNMMPGPAFIGASSSGIMDMVTTFAPVSSSASTVPLRPRHSFLYVETDSFGRIEACSSRTTRPYSCRTVTKTVNGRSAIAQCTSPFEQLLSCGVEDSNIAESNPNYMIPTLPGDNLPPGIYRIPAEHDTYVTEIAPTATNGGAGTMRAILGPPGELAYMWFLVPADIPGTILSAKLRLYVTEGTADGPEIFSVGSGWNEGALNWNNKPPLPGFPIINFVGAVAANNWLDTNVAIPGPGSYGFAVRGSADSISFQTKEPDDMIPHLELLVQPFPGAGGRCECYDAESSSITCTAVCCRL
jgi:type II secretory pathway pseudopilin PulG